MEQRVLEGTVWVREPAHPSRSWAEGDKYTELQAHAKPPSPLIFLKQRINVPAAWGGKFLWL